MRISDWSSDVCSSDLEGVGSLVRITDFASSAPSVPLASARLLAPIDRPGKYLAIGMNYRKHVEEGAKLGIAEPKKQLWFNKQTTSITGPFDGIVQPRSEEHTSELQSLMRISYAVFCLQK